VHGELLVLGVKVAASTVWEILHDAGIDPAPERSSTTWAGFLRSQAGALLACDFFETVTLSGARLHVFAVIEHASRRIRILGATAHPTASWAAQAARNLVMDLDDAGCRARFLIRDRDGKFPGLFDVILADAGIDVVLSGVRMPRMNSIMERWVQTCQRELLDRTLIWNQSHLLHALREFEQFYNCSVKIREAAPEALSTVSLPNTSAVQQARRQGRLRADYPRRGVLSPGGGFKLGGRAWICSGGPRGRDCQPRGLAPGRVMVSGDGCGGAAGGPARSAALATDGD
jgi:putative transposase